jgi:TonB-dependent starch-binding outer membrane protein SusC
MKQLQFLLLLLPLLLLGNYVFAQNKEITGKVTDQSTGKPVSGVSVLANNVKGGATTNNDGTYIISVKKNSSTLIFSSVGFATQSISIEDKTVIDVALTTQVKIEDDVVVIGYGTQKKSSVTGAVSKYKNEKLDQSPVSRLDQALQGKIAGVQVQNLSSEAGSDPKVQIRGISSISAGQSPLVVIDGLITYDGLSFVNMSDVESVEVLKDAASAAIYGSRGANGVIIVTTKSGKAQKTKYSLKMSWGIKNPIKKYPILTTTEYTNLLYSEAALRYADSAAYVQESVATLTPSALVTFLSAFSRNKGNLITSAEKASYLLEKDFFGGVPTEWQDAALRPGNVKNIDLSVNGGTRDFRYYLAGAYQNDQGMILNSEYERFNVRSKFDAQISKKLKVTVNVNPSLIKRERPSAPYTDFARVASYLPLVLDERTAAYIRTLSTNSTVQAGDFAQPRIFNDLAYSGIMPDGSLFTNALGTTLALSSSANNSPYSVLQTRKITTTDYRLTTSADITYTINKNFSFKSLGSVYISYTDGLDFAKKNSNRQGDVSKGIYTEKLFTNLLNENTFNFNKQIGEHSIAALAGITFEKKRTNNDQTTGLSYLNDNITTLNTATAIELSSNNIPSTFNNTTPEGLISYLGRVTYSYKNKYLLLASLRADKSSIFAPKYNTGYFPAVSVGWVANKEKFLEGVKWLSNLKLRGSYGALGNNNIASFQWLDLLNSNNYITGFGTAGTGTVTQGITPSSLRLSNPLITWERTFQTNGGLDVGLFKNAVSFSLDVYRSKTEKLLLDQTSMGITGVPIFINNVGSVQNDGVEFEITSNNIKRKNFTWTTSANIARTRNKVLELGNETRIINFGERVDGYISKVGAPITQFFGYKTDGIWSSRAQIDEAIAKGLSSTLSSYFVQGSLKFVDVNNDNIINADDRTELGNAYPDYTWGITNSFTYKGFDIGFTFQGVKGGKVLNGDGFYNEARKINKEFITNRWISPANPGDGKTPYFTNGYTNAWTESDYLLTDASYLALREVLIGYSLPKNWIQRMHLNNVRAYFTAQNLFFKANKDYKGLNIEARNTNGPYANPFINGYQRGAFPTNRTIIFGLDINF